MTNYAIRRVRLDHFEIAKFPPGEDAPTEVYKIVQTYDSPEGVCSCPAYVANCKHIKMLKRWKVLAPSDQLAAMFSDRTDSFFHLVTEQQIKELVKW